MPTVPGAVGAFRREALEQVGGVSDDTLAEDTDLTIAVGRRGWRIVYEDGARAWTEAPTTWGQLWRQRYRWSYGTMQSIWKHRRAVFERGASGRFGRIGLPHLAVFQVLLPLLAPLVDIFLVYGLLFHRPWETVLGWSGVLLVQLLGAVYAFRLDRERLRLLWLLPLQQVVYRQLMYAVL
ncbi:glycosyltransferase, partial [Streptomyces griseoaurantiacus]